MKDQIQALRELAESLGQLSARAGDVRDGYLSDVALGCSRLETELSEVRDEIRDIASDLEDIADEGES